MNVEGIEWNDDVLTVTNTCKWTLNYDGKGKDKNMNIVVFTVGLDVSSCVE